MTLLLSGTNGLSDVDGSASTPAVRGTDTNTGIFFPAADTIAFAEGGAEVARFDSSGNLGIGTSSPVYQSQIYGTGQTTAALTDAGNKGGSLLLNTPTVNAGDGGVILFGAGGSGAKPFAAIKGLLSDGGGNTVGHLAFATRNGTADTALTERMRLDSSGNLLVNTTSQYGNGSICVNTYKNGSAVTGLMTQPSTNANYDAAGFRNSSGSYVGYISCTSSATSYVTSSDYRLKENIAPMTGALAKVSALKPCTYTWKADGSDGQGFIAHELAEVCPDAVVGEKDAVNEDGTIKAQGIDTSFLVATLTAAIQEQQAIIETLKTRIEALEQA